MHRTIRVTILFSVFTAFATTAQGAMYSFADDFTGGVGTFKDADVSYDPTVGGKAPGSIKIVDPKHGNDDPGEVSGPMFWVGESCTFPEKFTVSYWVKLNGGISTSHINVLARNKDAKVEWIGLYRLAQPLSAEGEVIEERLVNFGDSSSPWEESRSFSQIADEKVAEKGWKKEEIQIWLIFVPGALNGTIWVDDVIISAGTAGPSGIQPSVHASRAPSSRYNPARLVLLNGRLEIGDSRQGTATYGIVNKAGVIIQGIR